MDDVPPTPNPRGADRAAPEGKRRDFLRLVMSKECSGL